MTDDELLERLRQYSKPGRGDDHPQAVACREAKNRIEQLTAERDKAYASGYSDAETEISKSALGQKIDFLHSQYAKYESAWMTAEGKLADAEALIEAQAKDHASNNIRFAEAEHRAKTAEAERDRLRRALHYYADFHSVPSDGPWGVNSKDFGTAARAALKGESHD